jgi:archaellin
MISTKHTSEVVENVVRGKIVKKPKVVIDYNTGKTPIDFSDQMCSYSNSLRRSAKWYRKVALDALLNIAVVNSMVLFNRITSSKMSINDFRTSLVEHLIKK